VSISRNRSCRCPNRGCDTGHPRSIACCARKGSRYTAGSQTTHMYDAPSEYSTRSGLANARPAGRDQV
jgi:hypothetical protein